MNTLAISVRVKALAEGTLKYGKKEKEGGNPLKF